MNGVGGGGGDGLYGWRCPVVRLSELTFPLVVGVVNRDVVVLVLGLEVGERERDRRRRRAKGEHPALTDTVRIVFEVFSEYRKATARPRLESLVRTTKERWRGSANITTALLPTLTPPGQTRLKVTLSTKGAPNGWCGALTAVHAIRLRDGH